MIAYKLCRQLKNGDITSLFINNTRRLPFDEWMEAEAFPTKGFKERPYWHCTSETVAPHLSKKNRVWVKVEMDGYKEMNRPESQGGKWFLASNVKLLNIVE
tara:strand:+ start:178322 stop:178624 length:303 start_codon:yes stop_codon:yes gene_type:complete